MDWDDLNSWAFYAVSFIVTLLALIMGIKFSLDYLRNGKQKTVNAQQKDVHKKNVGRTDGTGDKKGNLNDIDEEDDATLGALEEEHMPYVEHLQSEVKRAQSRVTDQALAKDLSTEQLQEESVIRKQQLESIFKLMSEQSDKFGVNSMDDIQQQMKLYT